MDQSIFKYIHLFVNYFYLDKMKIYIIVLFCCQAALILLLHALDQLCSTYMNLDRSSFVS